MIRIQLISRQKKPEMWAIELEKILRRLGDVDIRFETEMKSDRHITFLSDGVRELELKLDQFNQKRTGVIFLVSEKEEIPALLETGQVDDVLIHPFRITEVLSKLRYYQQTLAWNEVEDFGESFESVVMTARSSLEIARNLHRRMSPSRTENFKGFRVESRYIAGFRSGGDYFDLAEGKKSGDLSLFLTDSSSYGLSSAVTSLLASTAMRLNREGSHEIPQLIESLWAEIQQVMSPQDELSFLYGRLERKTLTFQFMNFGNTRLLHRSSSSDQLKEFKAETPFPPLSVGSELKIPQAVSRISLQPGDRLLVLSDGYEECLGKKWASIVKNNQENEAEELLTQLAFELKRKLDPDDLPDQDCTAIVLDLEDKILRLAS